MRAFYYLFSSAILACNLFFQVEAVIPNKIAESAASPKVAQPIPNDPGIEGMWCRLIEEEVIPGCLIYQYLRYQEVGNYSMDKTIEFPDKSLPIDTKQGQYGLYHMALRIQSIADKHKHKHKHKHKERCKTQTLPGIWMKPAEADSIIYELTFSKEEDINKFLKRLSNQSPVDVIRASACIYTRIDKLTGEQLRVIEPTDNILDPYVSCEYEKTKQLMSISDMDKLQTYEDAREKMKLFEDRRVAYEELCNAMALVN